MVWGSQGRFMQDYNMTAGMLSQFRALSLEFNNQNKYIKLKYIKPGVPFKHMAIGLFMSNYNPKYLGLT